MNCKISNCSHLAGPASYFCSEAHNDLWLSSQERQGIDFSDNTGYEYGVSEFAHRISIDENISEADIL